MKIAVVHPGSGWILDTIALQMCEAMPEVFISVPFHTMFTQVASGRYTSAIPRGVSGVYYIDVQSCWLDGLRQDTRLGGLIHVALFTHLHENKPANFISHWADLDGLVHMAALYHQMFLKSNVYPPERMILSRPANPCSFRLRKMVVGICQRGGYVGKGSEFLPAVVKALDPKVRGAIKLVFLGKDWIAPQQTDYHGMECLDYGKGEEPYDIYQNFYESLDCLLVPSLWTAGPMAMLEAMAVGIPIITSRVGWAFEFGEYMTIYEPGDVRAVVAILTSLAGHALTTRAAVAGITYRAHSEDVAAFCERLIAMRSSA